MSIRHNDQPSVVSIFTSSSAYTWLSQGPLVSAFSVHTVHGCGPWSLLCF